MFGEQAGHRLGGPGYELVPGLDLGDLDCAPGGALCCGATLLTSLILGGIAMLSLGTLPPLHYGMSYNFYTKVSDTEHIHGPGRHLIGPFNRLLLFPSQVQTIEFTNEPRIARAGSRYEALHTRTKEGLGLHLQVSLQYRLMQDQIGQLYTEFNQNYEQVFVSSVRDILIKAASEYEAIDLWEKRQAFGNIMQDMVDKELSKTYARCWGLQLIHIELPDEYESSITRSEVQKQRLYMKEQEQLSTKIRAETDVIRAEYDRKVKVIMAEGRANYTLTTRSAMAEAQQNKIDVEARVFGTLRANLSMTPDLLVRYSRYGAVGELEEATLIYGFGGRASMLLGAPGQ